MVEIRVNGNSHIAYKVNKKYKDLENVTTSSASKSETRFLKLIDI